MMKNLLFISLLIVSSVSSAQTPTLHFDGVDDYVNLGTDAADGARTIEFWFKLDNGIDATLPNEKMLVGTDVPDNTNNNVNEWHITFTQSSSQNAGRIRFVIVTGVGQTTEIVSDQNQWFPEKWYHVAYVVDPTLGMSLFIDGIKQQSTQPSYPIAIFDNGYDVYIGAYELNPNRFFEGNIEDLRFSSEALYVSDFTPPCPNIGLENSTIGLWNFNEGSGTVAVDSSTNANNGQINGPTWSTLFVCGNVGIDDLTQETTYSLYPNPAKEYIQVDFGKIGTVGLEIHDASGKLITKVAVEQSGQQLDVSSLVPGFYTITLSEENGYREKQQLIIY